MTATITDAITIIGERLPMASAYLADGKPDREAIEQALSAIYDAGRDSTKTNTTELVTWQQIASVWVPGQPVRQPRPAFRRAGKFVQTYTPDPKGKLKAWKHAIACASLGWQPQAKLDCPVRVDITLYFERPKRLMRRKDDAGPVLKTTTPDVDNVFKSTTDAMTDCGWWTDDALICAGETIKLYHAKTGKPGALIVVSVPEDEQGDLFQQESQS